MAIGLLYEVIYNEFRKTDKQLFRNMYFSK